MILKESGFPSGLSTALPPLVIGVIVQFVNMPLVRATITIQDPKCELATVRQAIVHLYTTRGIKGLWHGVSAGIMKTVPKYITAVAVKDWMEDVLPKVEASDKTSQVIRSAVKSIAAGVSGAVLTNPLDVLRNE